MDSNTLYHYTDLNAFSEIIKSKKLRFTRIDC